MKAKKLAEEIASKQVSLYLKGRNSDPANELHKRFVAAMEEYASQSKPLPTQEEVEKVLSEAKHKHDKLLLTAFIEDTGPTISRYKYQAAEIIKLFTHP